MGLRSMAARIRAVGGELTTEQSELHSLVRAAELAAIERCAPGTEWRDVHLTAAVVIAELEVVTGERHLDHEQVSPSRLQAVRESIEVCLLGDVANRIEIGRDDPDVVGHVRNRS